MLIVSVCATARSGKSTACGHLKDFFINRGYLAEIHAFSDPLKQFLRQYLELKDDQLWGENKDSLVPQWGKTSRELMQAVGHGMRELICPDIWLKVSNSPVNIAQRVPHIVLIPDNRYPNETDAIRNLGGITVKIIGRNVSSYSHPSETQISQCRCEFELFNTGDLACFKQNLNKLGETILSAWLNNSQTQSRLQELEHASGDFGELPIERGLRLKSTLKKHSGNISLVAKELGYSRAQIYRWIREYKIDVKYYRDVNR